MPEISHFTVCIDGELWMRQQQERGPSGSSVFAQITVHESRRPFSPTCFDFHMFFRALSLIFSSRYSAGLVVHLPFITAASTFQLIPLTASVFPLAGAGFSVPPTLRRAVNNNPGARPGADCSDRLPPATGYYQRLRAALLCQVAGHVTHSEANAHTAIHTAIVPDIDAKSVFLLCTSDSSLRLKVLFCSLPLCVLNMHHLCNHSSCLVIVQLLHSL